MHALIDLLAVLAGAALAALAALLYRRQRRRAGHHAAELAAIVQSSHDAIIAKSLAGVVTAWNGGAERLFGYSAGEALGRPLLELIVPEQLHDEERRILRGIAAGEAMSGFETVRRRKDGSLVDVSVTISPIRSARGQITGAAKTVRDISRQKAAEAEVRQLNLSLERQVEQRTAQVNSIAALQRAMLDHAGYAIIATDTAGLITAFNPAAERMLGYRAQDVVGRHSPALFHDPGEVARRAAAFAEALGEPVAAGFDTFVAKALRGLPNEHEWRYRRRDGGTLPVLLSVTALRGEDGALFGYLGMAADLSERRAAEAALEASHRFLDTLAANIPGLIGYWDRALRCRFANPAYLEWFGAVPVLGTTMAELLGEDMYRRNIKHARAALRGQARRFERSVTTADGRQRHTLVHYIPDRDGDTVRGFVALVSDVTELKHAQLTLQEMNHALQARTREAEAASRAKSSFLANMSHELRTPMHAVLGMLQLLQQGGLDAHQADYAAKAGGAARTLLGILDDILDFSRVEAGKLSLDPQPFSLQQLLDDMAVVLGAAVGARPVDVLFDIDPAVPPRLRCDALRLQQVLINLAGNAIKFTEHGRVVLACRLVQAEREAPRLAFSVHDTGIGIAAEHRQRIFDGFSQAEASTARRYGGSGLGLAISRRLVAMLGGELLVDSVPGQGSTFHFTIACDAVTQAAPAAPPLRCLLVEEDGTARAIHAGMLAANGWHVRAVAGAAQAAALPAGSAFDAVLARPEQTDFSTLRALLATRQPGQAACLMAMLSIPDQQRMAALPAAQRPCDAILVRPLTSGAARGALASWRGAAGAPPQPVPAAAPPPLAGLRILLVEDNPINQQVGAELLGHAGARVSLANGGNAALAALAAPDARYDIVLMDVQMPDMDGYTATRALRALPRCATLPVVAITANAMASDRAAALAAGMNAHIGKPFELAQLLAVILRHAAPQSGPAVLDSAKALARLGGLRTAYLGVLDALPAELERVAVQLARGRAPDLATQLHSLRGVAATAGADRLAALARRAEQALRADADGLDGGADAANALAALPDALAAVQAAARHAAAAIRQAGLADDPSTVPDGAPPLPS